MKQGYKFLSKHLPIILGGSLATMVMGVIAMKLGYNVATSWLKLTGVCTILFALMGIACICYAVFIAKKMPEIHLVRIKKNVAFLRIASVIAFIMLFFMFVLETYKLVIASYQEQLPEYFTVWRILKYILALPASAHFLLMAIPTKTKRKKRVKIPKFLSYAASVGAILWGIFGLLSAYFFSQMSIKNIFKIWQLIVYLVFILFFLFEAKFDHLNQGKTTARGFVFTSCLAFIVACAFSLTTTVCMILRITPVETSVTFSATEVFTSFTIGLYAIAKLYAYVVTVNIVAYNSEDSSSSSKFKKNRKSEIASSDNNDYNTTQQANTVETDEI